MRAHHVTVRAPLAAALLLTAASCAEIGDGVAVGADDDGIGPDAGVIPTPSPDAASEDGLIRLTQTSAGGIVAGNSVACATNDPAAGIDRFEASSFYRIYDLVALGLDGGVDVERVDVGLESAGSPAGSQPLHVRLHTLAPGAFVATGLTQVAQTVLEIVDRAEPGVLEVPLTATVGGDARLVVEYHQPVGDGVSLFIGSAAGQQSGPGYWRSPACGFAEPTDLATTDFASMRIVLDVVGRRR